MRRTRLAVLAVAFVAVWFLSAGCSRSPQAEQQVSTQPVSQPQTAPQEQAPAAQPQPGSKTASRPAATTPTQRRAELPASVSQAPAPKPQLVIPAGTQLEIRTTTKISTATHKAGDSFEASLAAPLVVEGRMVAEKGATVTGRIVESDPGGRIKGVASIQLQLTGLRTAAGRDIKISTNTIEREAATTKGQDAAKVGIGAGVGAAIGALAGGGKGAAIGAAAGAGAGTGAVLATRGKAAEVPAETRLTFKLSEPVRVPE